MSILNTRAYRSASGPWSGVGPSHRGPMQPFLCPSSSLSTCLCSPHPHSEAWGFIRAGLADERN